MKPSTLKTDLQRFGLRTLCVLLGLLCFGTGGTNAAVIIGGAVNNGNLDATSVSSQTLATPTGWTVVADRTLSGTFNDGASSEGFANFSDPGGSGLFFKPFQGNAANGDVTVHLFQDNPGTPGMQYSLSGYAGAEANYSGLIPGSRTKSEFAIEFFDAGNSVIGGLVLDLTGAGLGTPNGNPFGYAQYTVTATAPAGTATVRARASMIEAFANPAGGGQAFVVDAFELNAVPEPASFGLAGLGLCLLARRRRN